MLAAAWCRTPHVLVLPPMSFGFSPHHQTWPGTISLSLNTFVSVVTDVVESLHRTGFQRMLIVNGHGGNDGPLIAACTALTSNGFGAGFVDYFSPGQKQWLELLPGQLRRVGHACAYETSIQLALRPDAEIARIMAGIENLPPRLSPPYLVEDVPDPLRSAGGHWGAGFGPGDVGYEGDPAVSSPDVGQSLLEQTVRGLAEFMEVFAATRFSQGKR